MGWQIVLVGRERFYWIEGNSLREFAADWGTIRGPIMEDGRDGRKRFPSMLACVRMLVSLSFSEGKVKNVGRPGARGASCGLR